MTPIQIEANNAAQASAIYSAMRDASGQGASTWPDGEWSGHRISYNGRVWEAGKDWPEARCIYNPWEAV